MQCVGLIGGMSFESTLLYYERQNRSINSTLGALHSGKIAMYSFDFQEIEALQSAQEWEKLGEILGRAGKGLRLFGADFLAICTNTMHLVADRVEEISGLKVLNLLDCVSDLIRQRGLKKVALLGTNYTMTIPFYAKRLEKSGAQIITPNESERAFVHGVIYNELCAGKILSGSKARFIELIERLRLAGAEAVILGCTEIGLLISQEDVDIPLFDTTQIHIASIAKEMINPPKGQQ